MRREPSLDSIPGTHRDIGLLPEIDELGAAPATTAGAGLAPYHGSTLGLEVGILHSE
jgi:hypothetical protein